MVQEGLGNHSSGESGALSVESLALNGTGKQERDWYPCWHTRQAGQGPQGTERARISHSHGPAGGGALAVPAVGLRLYPFSPVPYSVLFTFSLHVNAEEKKNRAWVASPGPLRREPFSSCFTPKMMSGSVTSSHPTAALEPSLPCGCSGFGSRLNFWMVSSIRDCLGHPGMEDL